MSPTSGGGDVCTNERLLPLIRGAFEGGEVPSPDVARRLEAVEGPRPEEGGEDGGRRGEDSEDEEITIGVSALCPAGGRSG